MRHPNNVLPAALLAAALIAQGVMAQQQRAAAPKPAPGPGAPRFRPPAFPERAPAGPAKVERGKAIFGVNCTFCHGADARGGSGGTNLIRAELVMNDTDGELIGP